jgi:hypothetical protein
MTFRITCSTVTRSIELIQYDYAECFYGEYHSGCRDNHHIDIQPNDIKHKDIKHNDTQHNDNQHNDTQHIDIQHNDTQHNDIQHNNKRNATLSIMALNTGCTYPESHLF